MERRQKAISVLKNLLAAAKALPAPVDEEKQASQKVKDASDAKAEDMMKVLVALEANPDKEEIGLILEKVLGNKEMNTTMEGFTKLFDLKDNSGLSGLCEFGDPEELKEPADKQ